MKLVKGPWNAAYLDELTAFPRGKYSDQVDASSGAFNKPVSNFGDYYRQKVNLPAEADVDDLKNQLDLAYGQQLLDEDD